MAAKFEVYIVSGNYLSIQLCQAIFPHVGEIQFSGTCTVWDSWQPTKEIMVYLQDDKEMEACLSSGKILHFYGAAGPHMIGARQYFEHGVFCTELWIDTSRLPDLDTNMPNDFCNSFCRSVRRNMLGLDQTVEMKFFAMGTEMSIDFSEQLEECINESHGVMCYWSEKTGRH